MNDSSIENVTILVVDDNPTNLKILFHYLKEAGFKILVANNGHKAIEQVKRLPPDLILLDVMMPGLDGFETCRRLKAQTISQDIPVIFMTALADTDNKMKGFEAGAVDYITKPFQQEEVLARINTHLTIQYQKKALQDLNVTKDKFFSIIAHDLKGAFGSLLGYSNILAESARDYSTDEIEQIGKNLYSSAKNTFRLLQNLLDWARIQRGTVLFQPKKVDFRQIVTENFALLNIHAKQKKINLSHTIEPDTFVYADSNMLKTILRNLVSNAIKFTHNNGEVNVSTKSTDNAVEVSVKDTGIGISKTTLPKLFRLDQKTNRSGTAGEEGTGLGLLLCKEFVEKNGGRIWVESKPGQGTTFLFTLPKESKPSN